jgi:hypothetical protein
MTSDLLPEDIARTIADQIDDLARETGSAEWRYAARLLRGEAKAGPKEKDDAEALSRVRCLIAAGRTEWQALGIVARKVQPESPRAAVRRLRDKLKKQGR